MTATEKICFICQQNKEELIHLSLLDKSLQEIFTKKFPNTTKKEDIEICNSCANNLRMNYISYILEINKSELLESEQRIIKSYKEKEEAARNIELEFEKNQTFGEKVADVTALFGGSWYFIIFFIVVIILWMIINTTNLFIKHYDPYPFILLNLVLSCLAALQAPVIIMSQNRQAVRDRNQAKNDYTTNLKAELEIQFINSKLDQLIKNQWGRLLNIQQMQIELLENFYKEQRENSNKNV